MESPSHPVGQIVIPTCFGREEGPATVMLNAIEAYANPYGSRITKFNYKLADLPLLMGIVSHTTTTSGKNAQTSITNSEGSRISPDAEVVEGR